MRTYIHTTHYVEIRTKVTCDLVRSTLKDDLRENVEVIHGPKRKDTTPMFELTVYAKGNFCADSVYCISFDFG